MYKMIVDIPTKKISTHHFGCSFINTHKRIDDGYTKTIEKLEDGKHLANTLGFIYLSCGHCQP